MTVDMWKDWKPGNPRAAHIARGKNWIGNMLIRHKIDIPGIDSFDLVELGKVSAQALDKGLGPNGFAKLLETEIDNPLLRGPDGISLTIALIVGSAAANAASYNSCIELGVEKVQWIGHGLCTICSKNIDQIRKIGEEFESGHLFPPACVGCYCGIMSIPTDPSQ